MKDTAWGPLTVRDAHVHLFSHRFFCLLTGTPPEETALKLGWEAPPPEPELLAGRWAAELDRHGVDSAALIASVPGDEDSVARALRHLPSRFHGYFMANPRAEGALDRTRSALDAGLRTVCLFPAMHHYSVAGDELQPFWELLAGRPGTNVFVHCGVLSVGIRKKLGLPSYFQMRFSNPLDVQAVAQRFPQLRFIIPHFGAGLFRESLMLADHCPNVYLDTSSSNNWVRYSEGDLDLERVFRKALAIAGPQRLLFGTDSSFFPRGWVKAVFEEQAAVLHRIGISQPDAAAIFGGNLAALQA